MRRGEVWWALLALPAGRRPVVLVSRDSAYVSRQRITIVEISTMVRGLMTEVSLSRSDGMPRPCVANADNIVTIYKSQLESKIVSLSTERLTELDKALAFSLGLDSP